MIKKYIKNINQHYNETISKYGFNIKGLGWRKGGLNKRYEIMINSYNFKNNQY